MVPKCVPNRRHQDSGPSRASEPGGWSRTVGAVRTEPALPGPESAKRRRRGDREPRRPVSADGQQTARHPAAIPVAVGLAPEPLPLLNRQRPRQGVFASVPWWDSRGGQIEAGPGPRGKEQDRGRPLGRTQPPFPLWGSGPWKYSTNSRSTLPVQTSLSGRPVVENSPLSTR